jgi:hypothetical protein
MAAPLPGCVYVRLHPLVSPSMASFSKSLEIPDESEDFEVMRHGEAPISAVLTQPVMSCSRSSDALAPTISVRSRALVRPT